MADVSDPMETGAGGSSAFDAMMTSKKRTREEQVASLPWVEKYRPKDMDDLVSHEEIISTVTRLIDAGKLPHLLLYGPPGTGKTSTILACAHKMYGKNFNSMVLELNASDDRGIDVVRDQIKEFASTRQMFTSAPKLIVLDEADAMTNAAQFALRRVIEKYTRNARFCLICNYASKIIPALQSRCTRFRFAPLAEEQAKERLQVVADAEKVNSSPEGIDACVTLGTGDMRKCINILQSTHMAFPKVDMANVYQCTGAPMPDDVNQILAWLTTVRAMPPPPFPSSLASLPTLCPHTPLITHTHTPLTTHPRASHPLQQEDFDSCFNNCWTLMSDKGLALQDVLTALADFAKLLDIKQTIQKAMLLANLADLEHRLSVGTNEKMQLAGLVGIFVTMRPVLV